MQFRESRIFSVLFTFASFFILSKSSAQIFDVIPIDFDQVQQAQVLRNPALQITSESLKLTSGYKGFSSLSSNIRTYYADISGTLPMNKRFQIGAQIYQDQEGKLISHDRFYLKSNYSIALSSELNVSLGLAMGLVNYQIKSNIATSGFADQTFDIKGGICFKSKRLDIQGSFLQLLDQELMLLTSEIELKRYYQLLGTYNFRINPILILSPSIFIRSPVNKVADLRIGTRSIFYDNYYLGATFHHKNGYILEAGIQALELDQVVLEVGFSFRQWVNNERQINANLVELTLGIGLKKSIRGYIKNKKALNK